MVNSTVMRERLFTIRMSDEESARLDAVAKHYGLNAAGVLRMIIKREYDSLPKEQQSQAPRKPKKPRRE